MSLDHRKSVAADPERHFAIGQIVHCEKLFRGTRVTKYAARYSALMFAALMIGHHFSISAF
jgi:hypothetical protein